MTDESFEWELKEPPSTPKEAKVDLKKAHYQAQLDHRTSRVASDQAIQKAFVDADLKGLDSYYAATIEVAKGSIERARAGAEAVRNAAAAVGVLYSAVLGVAFSVDEPLPVRGLLPTAFLGLAIALATAYVAWIESNPEETGWAMEGAGYREDQRDRTRAFVEWIRTSVDQKSYTLRAAVLALGFGILFLPIGFVTVGTPTAPSEPQRTWPREPTQVSDAKLQEILYTAQVEEAAEIRAEERASTGEENFEDIGVRMVYGAAGAALLAVFLLAWVFGKSSNPSRIWGAVLLLVSLGGLTWLVISPPGR
jgi:hypothetical protein